MAKRSVLTDGPNNDFSHKDWDPEPSLWATLFTNSSSSCVCASRYKIQQEKNNNSESSLLSSWMIFEFIIWGI